MIEIPDNAVVVGVSRRSGSPTALRWGAQYAKENDLPLVAVIVWSAPRPPAAPMGRPPAVTTTGADPEAAMREKLDFFVRDALGNDHEATVGVLHGSAVQTLASRTANARLLVLGSPRETTRAGQRVSAKLIDSARCPIVLMPREHPDAESVARRTGRRAAEAVLNAAARSGRPGSMARPVEAD